MAGLGHGLLGLGKVSTVGHKARVLHADSLVERTGHKRAIDITVRAKVLHLHQARAGCREGITQSNIVRHQGIVLECGSCVIRGNQIGGSDGQIAGDGIDGTLSIQHVRLQGQVVAFRAGVTIRQRQGLVGNHRALTGEIAINGDVAASRRVTRGGHSLQQAVIQGDVLNFRITRSLHGTVGDVHSVEGSRTSNSFCRDVARIERRALHIDGIGRFVSPNITDCELGSPRPNDIEGGDVACIGIQDHVTHRALVVGIRKAQGHNRGILRAKGTTHTKVSNIAILIHDQSAAVLTAGQTQRVLGLQFLVVLRQLYCLEAAGDAVLVLGISHGNGRILQAVGGDALNIVIVDGSVFIQGNRVKISRAEIQQTAVRRILQSGKIILGQSFASQTLELEGTTGVDLEVIGRENRRIYLALIKDNLLTQRGSAEVFDAYAPLLLEREGIVNGEAGRRRALTHGELCTLDMRLIGHHVTTLDSDGGVRIHMEFASCDSTSARDGERVRGLGLAVFRGGRAKEAFGIILSLLT